MPFSRVQLLGKSSVVGCRTGSLPNPTPTGPFPSSLLGVALESTLLVDPETREVGTPFRVDWSGRRPQPPAGPRVGPGVSLPVSEESTTHSRDGTAPSVVRHDADTGPDRTPGNTL